jgi:hypothetical protein
VRIIVTGLVTGLLLVAFDAPFWCFYIASLVVVPLMIHDFWTEEKEAREAEKTARRSPRSNDLKNAPGRAARPGAQ